MKRLNENDLRRLVAQAECGDEAAVCNTLRYYCDCLELEVPLDKELLWFLRKAFITVLDGGSDVDIFQIKSNKRKFLDVASRDYELALDVLYEYRVLGNSLEKAQGNVADQLTERRSEISLSVIERAWKKYKDVVDVTEVLACLSEEKEEEVVSQ